MLPIDHSDINQATDESGTSNQEQVFSADPYYQQRRRQSSQSHCQQLSGADESKQPLPLADGEQLASKTPDFNVEQGTGDRIETKQQECGPSGVSEVKPQPQHEGTRQ